MLSSLNRIAQHVLSQIVRNAMQLTSASCVTHQTAFGRENVWSNVHQITVRMAHTVSRRHSSTLQANPYSQCHSPLPQSLLSSCVSSRNCKIRTLLLQLHFMPSSASSNGDPSLLSLSCMPLESVWISYLEFLLPAWLSSTSSTSWPLHSS